MSLINDLDSYFDLNKYFTFREYPPRNINDLKDCLTLLKRTPYYLPILEESKIIGILESLLKEGVLQITMLRFNNRPELFPLFILNVFITESYARKIIQNQNNIKSTMMQFFIDYDSSVRGEHENPILDKEYIETADERHIYMFLVMVINPKTVPIFSKIPKQVRDKYADFNRTQFKKRLGGMDYRGFIIEIFDEGLTNTFIDNGYSLVHADKNNPTKTQDKRRFVVCKTKDRDSSSQLGIDPKITCHTKHGEWFSSIFNHNQRIANLTTAEKRVAYLLVLGFPKKDILNFLKIEISTFKKHLHNIGLKLQDAELIEKDVNVFSDDILKETLLQNQNEIHPIIVPLYPD